MSRLCCAPPRNVASSRAISVGVWPPSLSVRSSIGMRSGGLLLGRSVRGLAGALGRLIVGERLRRIDVAKALVQRRKLLPPGRPDAEALRDHADDRARLHLADTGERQQALLEFRTVAGAVPDRRHVAVILARDRGAELLRA